VRASTIYATIGTAATLGAGGLAAAALSAGSSAPPPTKTVTVNVGGPTGATGAKGVPGTTGPSGATGAQGVTGPAGGFECLTGYSPGILVLNGPGGQTRVYACLE
jgi:hypothetical protein